MKDQYATTEEFVKDITDPATGLMLVNDHNNIPFYLGEFWVDGKRIAPNDKENQLKIFEMGASWQRGEEVLGWYRQFLGPHDQISVDEQGEPMKSDRIPARIKWDVARHDALVQLDNENNRASYTKCMDDLAKIRQEMTV